MGLEQPTNYWHICSFDMGYAQVKSNHKILKMYIVTILHNMNGDVLHFVFVLFLSLHFVSILFFTFILHYTA